MPSATEEPKEGVVLAAGRDLVDQLRPKLICFLRQGGRRMGCFVLAILGLFHKAKFDVAGPRDVVGGLDGAGLCGRRMTEGDSCVILDRSRTIVEGIGYYGDR